MAKSSGYVSSGERPSVNRSVTKSVRSDRTRLDRMPAIMDAWRALKNPWVTVSNPNTAETNKKLVRVRANDLYGDPKASYRMSLAGGDK
jgi:hypothetical protein|tara:strand:- start:17086 stop:17352 length:267 start_codon:yes stop_codon:yes gene_type:complete